MDGLNLLDRQTYVMPQVDRLLALPSGTARRWIDGYRRAGKAYPPVVRLEPTGDEFVTWGEFAETRLLAEFRSAGVPLVRLRPVVLELREKLNHRYPLAHASPFLSVDGREIVMGVQENVGLDRELLLVVVRNGQVVLNLPTDQYVRSADFENDFVRRIRPFVDLDRVWLDPLRQFGEPVVRSVPTDVIAEQLRAGDRMAMIADLYDLALDDVEQAVRYELLRAHAAEGEAA
jgi:uncharacterized protein (DUF433 family)